MGALPTPHTQLLRAILGNEHQIVGARHTQHCATKSHTCALALPSFTSLQHPEFMYARLALRPGENEHYSDNDLVLLCKTDPMV